MRNARLLSLLLLAPVAALAEETASPSAPPAAASAPTPAAETAAPPAASLALPGRLETFGGVLMPAVLPQGASSLYAWAGAPEVGAGYRQGFGGLELEGRARFDYLRVALTGELAARLPLDRKSTRLNSSH